MSAATDYAEIVVAMTSISYTEIGGDLPIEDRSEPQRDKSYTFGYGEPNIAELASKATLTSDLIILEIAYIKNKTRTHAQNMDLLRIVHNTLKVLTNFAGLETIELIKDTETESGYNDIGRLEFYYNFRSC